MNKSTFIESFINTLKRELETSIARAKESFEVATDDESRGDGKYDTRGLEASYLAGGQALQAKELGEALDRLEQLKTGFYLEVASKSICLGSLFEVSSGKSSDWYFMANDRGGLEIDHDGTTITILTLQSPLGSKLLGASVGDKISLNADSTVEIISVF